MKHTYFSSHVSAERKDGKNGKEETELGGNEYSEFDKPIIARLQRYPLFVVVVSIY